jgi:dTMP kinase
MGASNLSRNRGRLIAIEGIDQAGKKTQTSYLAKEIRRMGRRVSVWDFPDYTTPLGRQLKAYLGGKVRFDMHVVHLLYAANRWEVADQLSRRIERGEVVIVNRYGPSNLAYGVAHGLPSGWLNSLEEGLPVPDLVLLLDISPRTSLERKMKRRDVHEGDLAYLKRVRSIYLRLGKRYGWKVIEGERDWMVVRSEVWVQVSHVLT